MTRYLLTVENGTAVELPGFGYRPDSIAESFLGGVYPTRAGARAAAAAPHVNARVAFGPDAIVWTSVETSNDPNRPRVIAREVRTTYYRAHDVTLFTRTTITKD